MLDEPHDEGSTLIEMLVVIIIIGVLAGIAIPLFLRQQHQGYAASMKADIHSVATAEESARTENDSYVAVTTNGRVATVGTDSVQVSPGNSVVTTSHDDRGFCLQITTTKSPSTVFYYDSASGGLQPETATSCPTAYAIAG